ADLRDEFALVSVPPAARVDVTILARAAGDHCRTCRGIGGGRIAYRGATERTAAAALVLAMSTVALLLVALVATAGFVVVAQRRTRQLGMLAAIGATGRHLRLVMLVNGAAVGVLAATVGAAVALAGWIGFAPRLENA